MKRIDYTNNFERFWYVWRELTGNGQDKWEAFEIWVRDKLEDKITVLIEALKAQVTEKKRNCKYAKGTPCWPYCRKWLNKRRHEYIPKIAPKTQVRYVNRTIQLDKLLATKQDKERVLKEQAAAGNKMAERILQSRKQDIEVNQNNPAFLGTPNPDYEEGAGPDPEGDLPF